VEITVFMSDDLRLRIAGQSVAHRELNVTSAALRASAEQIVAESREILAGVRSRRAWERVQASTFAAIPRQFVPPRDAAGPD
jgi:hypothetical protein